MSGGQALSENAKLIDDSCAKALFLRKAAVTLKQTLLETSVGDTCRIGHPNNPFRLAKSLGIDVAYVETLFGDARLYRFGNRWLMEIRKDTSPNRQRFSCAHELGHYLLETQHRELIQSISEMSTCGQPRQSMAERLCNEFAAELLCPTACLHEAIDSSGLVHLESLIWLSTRLRVSLQVAAIQAGQMCAAQAICGIRSFAVGEHAKKVRIEWSVAPRGVFIPRYCSVGRAVEESLGTNQPGVSVAKLKLGSVRGTYKFAVQRIGATIETSGALLLVYLGNHDAIISTDKDGAKADHQDAGHRAEPYEVENLPI